MSVAINPDVVHVDVLLDHPHVRIFCIENVEKILSSLYREKNGIPDTNPDCRLRDGEGRQVLSEAEISFVRKLRDIYGVYNTVIVGRQIIIEIGRDSIDIWPEIQAKILDCVKRWFGWRFDPEVNIRNKCGDKYGTSIHRGGVHRSNNHRGAPYDMF